MVECLAQPWCVCLCVSRGRGLALPPLNVPDSADSPWEVLSSLKSGWQWVEEQWGRGREVEGVGILVGICKINKMFLKIW